MHIESVHLHGFGRLAGREFRFGPGLTVVHGPNEAGKSTLHAALSAALFGLVGGGRRKKDDTARIDRFRPWDGARYAATADVVAAGGRRLRLEWDFDRGRVAVLDAAAGADMTREYGGGDPDQLVRAVWGVERGVYLHLGHVAQAELARISDPSGVRHAIEAVVGQGAADSPAQLAVALLKEHRSHVVGLNSAATKPLARARAERDALAGAVAEAELQRDAVDELAAERDSAHAAAAAAARRVHALAEPSSPLSTGLVARRSTLDAKMNHADVVNVGERVGVKNEEIGEFATFNRALLVAAANGTRRVDGVGGVDGAGKGVQLRNKSSRVDGYRIDQG